MFWEKPRGTRKGKIANGVLFRFGFEYCGRSDEKNIPEKRGIWRSVADIWPENALGAHISFLASFWPENGESPDLRRNGVTRAFRGVILAPSSQMARARALDNRGVPSGGC